MKVCGYLRTPSQRHAPAYLRAPSRCRGLGPPLVSQARRGRSTYVPQVVHLVQLVVQSTWRLVADLLSDGFQCYLKPDCCSQVGLYRHSSVGSKNGKTHAVPSLWKSSRKGRTTAHSPPHPNISMLGPRLLGGASGSNGKQKWEARRTQH